MTIKTYPTISEEIKQGKPFQSIHQEALLTLLRTSATLKRFLESNLKLGSLSLQQYNVLRILKGAGQPMPIMEISSRLVEPSPGVTRLVTKLEKQGFIKRIQCPKDRRVFYAEITDKGLCLLEETHSNLHETEQLCLEKLSKRELEELITLLNKARAYIPE